MWILFRVIFGRIVVYVTGDVNNVRNCLIFDRKSDDADVTFLLLPKLTLDIMATVGRMEKHLT